MATTKTGKTRGEAAKPAAKQVARSGATRRQATTSRVKTTQRAGPARTSSGEVLQELKALARELSQAAKGLRRRTAAGNPKEISAILAHVERITQEAANKSLQEAEAAKEAVMRALHSLGHDWSRRELDELLSAISGHLTNIIVAQEFQDLAGQSLRQAMKALVGAIVEAGGPSEGDRLSQKDVDALLNEWMP